MKILTESELRARCLCSEGGSYTVDADTFVTPLAREYLQEHGIALQLRQPAAVMPQTPLAGGPKPEEMTHLCGTVLVPKTHPRIRLRGRLDSLEAEILELQLTASESGEPELTGSLGELLEAVRQVLGCEVKEQPLPDQTLLGLSPDELRRVSHNVRQEFGFGHPVPNWQMGRLCVQLNRLRTTVREVELVAAGAFGDAEGRCSRLDILQALNRLSSAVYILFCRQLAKREGKL